MRFWLLCVLLLTLIPSSGCGGSSAPASGGDVESTEGPANVEPQPPEVKRVSADELPIGDPLPPLDEGRIELARPKDWSVPSRDSKYLIQFSKSKELFPRVIVTVEDDWSGLGDVTEDNVQEFAGALGERLETPEHKVALIEPVIPMVIGDRAVARYVRRTKFKTAIKSVSVERQVLVAVVADRVYTIDLQTPPGTLVESRDASYAVAASLQAAAGQ